MTFEVDIGVRVGGARRAFDLAVRFRTAARRTVLYGPSGAGKSLTLRAVAGLLRPDRGRIVFAGETLFDAGRGIDVPARERRLGYVFQDHALFPKLDVRQNVAFGLAHGWRNPRRGAADDRVDRWLAALELEAVAAQRPDELSGGQRQRTALARALVAEPRALLLDEPFSALDPALRQRTRAEVDRLLRSLGIPILLITHDPDDIAAFADETFAIRDGAIVDGDPVGADPDRADPPAAIDQNPAPCPPP